MIFADQPLYIASPEGWTDDLPDILGKPSMCLTEACRRFALVAVMTLGPRLNYSGQNKINEAMEPAAVV